MRTKEIAARTGRNAARSYIQTFATSILFSLFLGAFLCLTVLFDLAFVPSPTLGLYVLVGVLSAPALALALTCRRRWMLVYFGIGLLLILSLQSIAWYPRKRFVWDLNAIRSGMSVDEVEAVMGKYIKGLHEKWTYPDGPERRRVAGTFTYRWNNAQYNADFGQVTFESGRVVKAQFLED